MKASFDPKNEGDLHKEIRDILYEQIEDSQASVYKFQLNVLPGETILTVGLSNIPELFNNTIGEIESGQTNRGLKLISQKLDGKKLITTVEGLGDTKYQLGVVGDEYIKNIVGAEFDNGLIFKIPDNEKNKFYKHNIIIEFK